MRRRAAPGDIGGIPAELYYGIARGAFPWCGPDNPRSGVSSNRRHLWTDEVRRHGYTVLSLRKAAETDPGYQKWLEWRERRARVTAQLPEVGRGGGRPTRS